MAEEVEGTKVQLVYIGRRKAVKGIAHFYSPLSDQMLTDEKQDVGFKKKFIGWESVGCIIEATKTPGGKWKAAATRVGTFPDEGQITTWRALDAVIDAEAQIKKLCAQGEKIGSFDDALEPIYRAMSATNYHGQLAIQALVMRMLSRHANGFSREVRRKP